MCLALEFTYPIQGERLERLKARNADGSPMHPEEWAQWIRQESPALETHLRCLLRRQLNVEKDAEDALNIVWLTLLMKVGPHYDRSDLWRVFLFNQARAAASEVIRKGKREQPLGGARSGKEDGDSDVESCILNQLAARGVDDETEFRRAFDDLLELAQPKLNDLERTIVVRRFIDGETFAEIAAHIRRSLGTVTTTFYRALDKVLLGLMDQVVPLLTEDERQVVAMYLKDKRSFDEIAATLQRPVAEVMAIYREAMLRIW